MAIILPSGKERDCLYLAREKGAHAVKEKTRGRLALKPHRPSIPFTRAPRIQGRGRMTLSTRWHPKVQDRPFLTCALGSFGLGVTQTGDQEGTLVHAAAGGTADLSTQSTWGVGGT